MIWYIKRPLIFSSYPDKILYALILSPMCAACPAHLTLYKLMALMISFKHINYNAPPYATITTLLLLLPPLIPVYFPQYSVLQQSIYAPLVR
jgi:hypothetical protein